MTYREAVIIAIAKVKNCTFVEAEKKYEESNVIETLAFDPDLQVRPDESCTSFLDDLVDKSSTVLWKVR